MSGSGLDFTRLVVLLLLSLLALSLLIFEPMVAENSFVGFVVTRKDFEPVADLPTGLTECVLSLLIVESSTGLTPVASSVPSMSVLGSKSA